MRIGILTHPQSINYGGILQCYALFTYLRKIGHEPVVIQREADRSFFLWELARSFLRAIHFPRYYTPNKVDRSINIRPFIEKYLERTKLIRSQSQMRRVCGDYQLNAVIVGSDQVWRKSFALKFGYNYFLDFVQEGIKRMSYAASFGLSEWEYDLKETATIKPLLSSFSGISVREKEAVSLLKTNAGVDAIQHIDPTLLLSANDYSKIASKKLLEECYVFVYWLGAKEQIFDRIRILEDEGKKVVSLFLRDKQEQISIEDWLSYIKNADLIITDSFHGCVFSILFERKFEVFKNDSGGNGRIPSLLNILEINNTSTVNYLQVKNIIDKLRESATSYLFEKLQ